MSSPDDDSQNLLALICLELLKRSQMYEILDQSSVTVTRLCALGGIDVDTEALMELCAFAEKEYGMGIDPGEIEELLKEGKALLAQNPDPEGESVADTPTLH